VKGKDELIHQARQADEGYMPVTAGKVTVSFSCRCSHVHVDYGPGSTAAWNIPDGWMWEDDVDV
jgi:kynureninase